MMRNWPIFLVAILAAILVAVNLQGFETVARDRPAFVALRTLEVISPVADLCPGDAVQTVAQVTVNKPVIIMRSVQFWRIGEMNAVTPATVEYTAVGHATEFPAIPRAWTVPDLPAGEYERHSVFALPGQAADSQGQVIRFSIREGCGE